MRDLLDDGDLYRVVDEVLHYIWDPIGQRYARLGCFGAAAAKSRRMRTSASRHRRMAAALLFVYRSWLPRTACSRRSIAT